MPKAKDIYVHCDELKKLPTQHRENWLHEITLLKQILPKEVTVLQVGCMDGTRILAILKERPDVTITGLDIDEELLKKAQENFRRAGAKVRTVLGDIAESKTLRTLGSFDCVLCLNNTLGYIANEQRALKNMQKIGHTVVISVYGEAWTDELARAYFQCLGLSVASIKENIFHLRDFTKVKRFTRAEVMQWGGKVLETPLGYSCVIASSNK